MNIESVLKNVIAWKFRTQAGVRELGEDIFVGACIGLGYLARPIAEPIEKAEDWIYDNFHESKKS